MTDLLKTILSEEIFKQTTRRVLLANEPHGSPLRAVGLVAAVERSVAFKPVASVADFYLETVVPS